MECSWHCLLGCANALAEAASDLFIDAGVPTVLLRCASQYHSLQVWDDVELAIIVVVMLDPGSLDPHHLTPTFQQQHVTHSTAGQHRPMNNTGLLLLLN